MIKVPIFFQLNKLGIVGAQKELRKLTNQTKSFGLTSKLSIGAASVALTAYTKKALAAAIADEKAQKALTQTLKNLGLAYSTVGVTKYIDSLQRATGVSEDLLRPAFQRLILVLGDVGKAQSALALAMDVSAGTGKDLNAVSTALAKGFAGQTTALSRLGAGLDKALLKSGDMEAITLQLSKLFTGQALVAADTYAGQMAILGVAAQEASETIGVALIEALVSLSGENGVADLANQMETLAQSTANTVTGMAEMARLGKEFAGVAVTIGAVAAMLIPAGKLAKPAMAVVNLFKSKKVIAGAAIAGGLIGAERLGANKNAVPQGTNRQSARATERAAQMAAEKLNKTKKVTVDLNKKLTSTEKLKAMFDIDAIQIAAALKGNISELDRKSLLAMQALKTEDKNDDITALKEVEQAKIDADAADRARKIAALQNTISINKLALADVESTLAKISKLPVPIVTYAGGLFAGTSLAPSGTNAGTQAPIAPSMPVMPSTNAGGATAPDLSGYSATELKQGLLGPTTVNMTFNAGVISEEAKLARIMQAALQEANRNGWSTTGLAS